MKKKPLFLLVLLIISFLCFFPIQTVNGVPLYEDFTTYTEVEPDDRIQKTTNHIDIHTERNEDSYLYKDYGVNHFTDFTHDVNFYINSVGIGQRPIVLVWLLSNDLDDYYGLITNSKTAIGVRFYSRTDANYYRILLTESYGGTEYWNLFEDSPDEDGYDTWFYLKIMKSATSLKCGIYSTAELRDAGDATDGDIGNLSLTLQADHNFRYVFGCNTWNDGNADWDLDADIENLDLQEKWTVTFYNNIGGILKVNGTTISNGTSKAYYRNEVIELGALPLNSSYTFQNFTWNSNYNETNPHNLTITSDLTLWCYFDKPSTFSIGLGSGFILAFILSMALIIGVVAISRRRS